MLGFEAKHSTAQHGTNKKSEHTVETALTDNNNKKLKESKSYVYWVMCTEFTREARHVNLLAVFTSYQPQTNDSIANKTARRQ